MYPKLKAIAIAEYREQTHAVINAARPGSPLVSHQTALALHGMPTYGVSLADVHVTRLRPGRSGVRAGTHYHTGRLADEDQLTAHGLPTPLTQQVLGDENEPFARVDFYFPDHRTLVEFDGLVKYGDAADLARPDELVARIRQALARGARR